jgi:hypothetical protein
MLKDWNNIEKMRIMKHNYFVKLRELKSYGNDHRIPHRIQETKESIVCLSKEIQKATKR